MITFINESIGGNLRIRLNAFSFVFYSMSGIFVNFSSIFINYYSYYIWVSFITFTLSSLAYFYFLETPFYYYKKKDICGLHQCLLTICKRNYNLLDYEEKKVVLENELKFSNDKIKSFTQTYLLENDHFNETNKNIISKKKSQTINLLHSKSDQIELENEKNITEANSVKKYLEFFTKKNLFRYAMICIILLSAECMFGMSQILNKDLGIDNIFLTGSLIVTFQLFGYGICSFISTRIGRRQINFITNLTLISLGLILLTMNIINNSYQKYSERGQVYRIVETGTLTRTRIADVDDQFRPVRNYLLVHD